jgi:hypothetical protein
LTHFIKLTSDGNDNLLWLDWHRIVYLYPDDVEDNRTTRRVTVLVIQDLADDLWVQETPEQIVAMVDGAQRPDWLDSTR